MHAVRLPQRRPGRPPAEHGVAAARAERPAGTDVSTPPGKKISATGSLINDVIGGALSALFTIPAAMAFGALVVAPLGTAFLVDGVVMGLTGAAVAGLVAAAVGSRGMALTAPSGQLAVMLATAVTLAADDPAIRSVPPVVVVACTAGIAGVVQIIGGMARFGGLVAYLPYPVVAGCGTGAAALIVLSQAPALFGHSLGSDLDTVPASWNLGAIVTGLTAIAASLLSRRVLPGVPDVIPGLVAGLLAHEAMNLLDPKFHGAVIGDVPTVIPGMHGLLELRNLDSATITELIKTVAPIGVAAGVLGSILSLVAGAIVEGQTGLRRNSDRELLAQGVANCASSLCGGLPGALSESRSLLSWRAGARGRMAGISHAAVILIAGIVFAPLIGLLPVALLAALLILATLRALDHWTIDLLRLAARRGSGDSRDLVINLLVVIGVAGMTVLVSLFWGLILGLVIAVVQFIATMSRSVIRRHYRGELVHSKKLRSTEAMNLLAEHGHEIAVFELHGALFFGTADQFAREVERVAGDARWIISDLRRVTIIDSSGARIIQRIHKRLKRNGARLALAHMQPHSHGWGVFNGLGVIDSIGRDRCFEDIDAAMEWAEESLLSARGYALPAGSGHTCDDGGVSDLSDLDFTHGLSPDQLDVLRSYLDSREFAAGTVIFEEGSVGEELFILSTGQVSARTTLEHGRRMRLTTFSPGVVFGEMALLDGSTRSATAIADSDAQCMALTADSYRRLSDEHAEIALVITRNLGRLMAERLRLTNGQLRALEA